MFSLCYEFVVQYIQQIVTVAQFKPENAQDKTSDFRFVLMEFPFSMNVISRLITFRKKIRINQKKIIDALIEDHQAFLCIFCGSSDELSREHVIPQWVYGRCTKRTFITKTTGLSQTYHKTTLPACKECNSHILGLLEGHLKHEFDKVDFKSNGFTKETTEFIILWLETLEYKFQVLDLRRKLNRVNGSEYSPYIGKMPIAMFQGPIDASPSKVFSNLRGSLKTLCVKSKSARTNSLVVFSTTNTDFHFFHSTNNYIFIELAEFGVAFFYFTKRIFNTLEEAHSAAMEIIKKEYDREQLAPCTRTGL